MGLLELLIVVLLILWLLGYLGRGRLYPRGPAVATTDGTWWAGGSWVHLLLVIVLILVVLRLLGISGSKRARAPFETPR